MFLTFMLALLAAFGLLSILYCFAGACRMPLRYEDVFYVIYLSGDAASVEQTIKSCLYQWDHVSIRGRTLFVDSGMTPEAQIAAELLLREREDMLLCAQEQVCKIMKQEREARGAGTD